MNNARKKTPEMWASIIRIISCLIIFIYHYGSLYGIKMYLIDNYAIAMFLFISGYFSNQKSNNIKWLIQRFKAIMIPFWLVILPIIIINVFYKYKAATFAENLIVILGGAFFLTNPLYVISWFITLIIFLYISLIIFCLSTDKVYKFIVFIIFLTCFYYIDMYLYYSSFYLGYILRQIRKERLSDTDEKYFKLNEILFIIQNYCYSFFLIHGGILLLSIKILKIPPVASFIASFAITSVLSYFHNRFSLYLMNKLNF